jgi:hypothetical protein
MKQILVATLVTLLTAASISPSFARSRHAYSYSHVRVCAPHYDSAGVADGCL